MEKDILWELVGKKIAGEASPAELEELNRLLQKFPEALYSLETIDIYWRSSKDKVEHTAREAALERHMTRLGEMSPEAGLPDSPGPRPRRSFLSIQRPLIRMAAAAAIAGAIGLSGFWYWRQAPANEALTKTLIASKGSKNHFILPDGSKVWLNAGTSLTYPLSYSKDSIREVSLSGEAFFEIRHDGHHPFHVHTRQMDILDLGTSFNVKDYPLDRTSEATLVEGSIEVKMKNEKDVAILSAHNEKITVFMDSLMKTATAPNTTREQPVNSKKAGVRSFRTSVAIPDPSDSLLAETAWMKDILVFRNESFEDLATRMERWYDVSISFKNVRKGKYRFTGAFANETIEQALFELQQIKQFHFTLHNRDILIEE